MSLFRYTLLLICCLTVGCESLTDNDFDNNGNDGEDCNCNLYEEPESYDVKLKITINAENQEVPITVYYGNIERNRIATQTTVNSSPAVINLKTGSNYTYLAKYLKGSDTVYVPVHARLSTSYNICNDDTCWQVDNNVINLKLK